jgi:hypothetical protein
MSRLRIAVLAASLAETAFFVFIILFTSRHTNPKGDGMEWIGVFLVGMVFLPFTLPALLLGALGWGTRIAAVLAGIAAAADLYLWWTGLVDEIGRVGNH